MIVNFHLKNPPVTQQQETIQLKSQHGLESGKSDFNINMRHPGGHITVVGSISARYVVSMEFRNPQEYSSKRIRINFAN
ncbi:hypothetical protein CU098_011275, partial [Rhizopus stolonifer]